MSILRSAALRYAARGWPVFPLAPRGKTPLVPDGFKAASSYAEQIDAWWTQWPDANIGIPTGAASGLFVVDLDDKDGRDGSQHWTELATKNGGDGAPLEHFTGSGGLHLVYRHVEGLRNTAGRLGVGIDTRGEGGYIVAAPSAHPSGGAYSWGDTNINVIPDLPPGWLVDQLLSRALPDAPAVQLEGSHTLTRADLEAFVAYKSKFPDAAAHVTVARAVLAGTSWGKGARYTRMVEFLGALRNFVLDRHSAPLDPFTSAPLFDACTAAATEEGVDQATDRHWVVGLIAALEGGDGAYRGKLEAARKAKEEKVTARASKLLDGLPDVPEPVRAQKAQRVAPAGVSVEHAAESFGACVQRAFGTERTTPYSPDELQTMMPLEKRWVLVTHAGYFIRGPGGYVHVTDKGVKVAARDLLAPAFPIVEIVEITDKGERLKSVDELLHQYGQEPRRTVYDYTAPTSYLDGTCFVQKVGAPLNFEPEYNAQIDHWLKLFAGEQYDAVCDWLATLTQLERPTAALLIMGVSGAGKDLLVEGISQFWSGARTSFTRALDKFNFGLTRSPLVVANEQVRVPAWYPGDAPNALKEMISDTARDVEAKGKELVSLRGCVRVILATNSDGVLEFERNPTPSDIEALDERTLLVKPEAACKLYLKDELGGRKTTDEWVAGQGIARHVEWLRRTRTVQPGQRFLVEGRGGMSDLLSSGSRGARAVLRAVLDALLGAPLDNPQVANVWRGGVWVSAAKLKEFWPTFAGREPLPEDLAGLLNTLCEAGPSTNRKLGGTVIRMREVKGPVIASMALREGRLEELEALRTKSTDED